MQILSYSYNKALQYSKSKFAVYWLCFLSFLESFILPLPLPDILLALMSLSNLKKSYRYAFLCTISSIIGAIIGYFIGVYLSDWVIELTTKLGYIENFNQVKDWFAIYGIWVLIIAGFSPIPYKIFTIVAGIMSIAIIPFIIISFIARYARYFLVAFIVKKFGKNFDKWLKKYIDRLSYLIIILIILIIFYKIYA